MLRSHKTGLIAVLLVALTACSARAPQGRETADQLFERGLQQYERKRWTDAIGTFERLLLEYPGSGRTQEIRFYIADSYFGRQEYVTAAAEFARLAGDYPGGEYASRSRLRACEAYYELSPRPQLDQAYTKAAIDHCGTLAQFYPGTEYATRGDAIVAELHEKLAQKIFTGGEFYNRRRAYDSAVIYYEEVVNLYPQSSLAPRALLRLVEVYQTLGYVEEAAAARERLLREYPGTAEARAAEGISLATGS